MRTISSDRHPQQIEGLTHTRAPIALPRKTALLLAVVLFLSGLFVGAIGFGQVLIASIPNQEDAP